MSQAYDPVTSCPYYPGPSRFPERRICADRRRYSRISFKRIVNPVILPAILLLIAFCLNGNLRAATITSYAAGGPWSSGSTWQGGVVPGTGDAVIIATTGGSAVTITANVTQTSAGSVTINSGGLLTATGGSVTFGSLTIESGGTLTIPRPMTVLGVSNISGTINFGSTSGTSRAMVFTGAVTLNAGAVWSEPASGNGANNTYTFSNNFTNNATTFNALGTGVHTFSGTSKIIDGSTETSIASVSVTGTRTNNGIFTARTALNGTGTLTQGTNATLNILASTANFLISSIVASAQDNTVNYNGSSGQSVKAITYNHLTFAGTGAKTVSATTTVNGILSIENGSTANSISGLTYGTGATLQYNTSANRNASTEWVTPFVATGGVVIKNTGIITLNGAKQMGNNTDVPLNINGGTLSTSASNFALTLHGDFINTGTLSAGSSAVTITGTATPQTIDGFITTGTVSMTKSSGTATLTGAVSGAALTVNGTSGTLNLGTGLNHTFSGVCSLTAGNLNGGSSTLTLTGSGTVVTVTGGTFTAATGTVAYEGSGSQTVGALTYNNLTAGNAGTKTLAQNTTVNGTLLVDAGVTLDLAARTLSAPASVVLNGGAVTGSTILASSSGTLTLGGNVSVLDAGTGTAAATISCPLTLGATRTFTVADDGTTAKDLSLSMALNDATNGIVKEGAGTLGLDNAAVTLGSLTVNAGTLTSSSGTLSLNGNFSNSATFQANGGTVGMNGTSAQTIGGSAPTTFNNLTVDNTAGVGMATTGSIVTTVSGTLTINSGKKLTVDAGQWLTVSGTLANSAGAAGLVVKSDGSLIQHNAVSATVDRFIGAWGNGYAGYHFLSSPVTSQAIVPTFVASPTSNTEDFYAWWESTNEWVNYKNASGTAPVWGTANVLGGTNGAGNFIPGKGYLVEYSTDGTRSFTGTLNTANINLSNFVISTGYNRGWHLLGNPFPSALTWGTADWSLNHINTTAKIWREDWQSYIDIPAGTGAIPPLNGFMVQVTAGFSGNNSLTIPTAAQSHTTETWYKAGDEHSIELRATDLTGHSVQQSIVKFDNNATAGFDPTCDSHFIPGGAAQFYSVAGAEPLSTNVLPQPGTELQIPFDFIPGASGGFSISVGGLRSLTGPVYLTDLKTGTITDLTLTPVYTFQSATGDDPHRFLLGFSRVGVISHEAPEPVRVYASGGTIRIDSPGRQPLSGTVSVYDMVGRCLLSQPLEGSSATVNPSFTAGYCLVRVVTGTCTVIKKVWMDCK